MTRRAARARRWRQLLAGVALLAALGVLAGLFGSAVGQLRGGGDAVTPTAAAPAPAPGPPIRPLPVRPVTASRPLAPDMCPPTLPAPSPADPATACDVEAQALYTLGPQALALELRAVTVVEASEAPPASGAPEPTWAIRLEMDPGSAAALGRWTAAHLDTALAFVRDNRVVSAPTITAPLDSPSLELSGGLTREKADQLAALLRAPA